MHYLIYVVHFSNDNSPPPPIPKKKRRDVPPLKLQIL